MSSLAGQTEIEQVRDSTDLVALIGEHVPLRSKGREHVGLCPFHDDHTPSLAVVTHKGNAFYKCHSCGAALVVRDWYELKAWRLTDDGCCRACGTRCAGRFDGPPGDWGARRLPVEIGS